MNTDRNPIEKVNNMIKTSVTLKLITVTILMLLLLIPASMIQSIISEREQLSKSVIEEVSSKWAENQLINGPILTIPVTYEYENGDKTTTVTKNWHILPEGLKINGEVNPEILKRGIYEVVVYKSNISVSGDFKITTQPDLEDLKDIHYNKAFLTIGISDLRGIKNNLKFNWNDKELKVQPGSRISDLVYSGITLNLPDLKDSLNDNFNFNFKIDLQGSKNLSFTPLGNTTSVTINSPWQSPSFKGNYLPDDRTIDDNGFTASWSVLQLNRNFAQSWVGPGYSKSIEASAFGVDLILPLDDYQKSYRSAKYAAMTIALTFLIFFLVEIINKKKIHPFQYALVGLALCLFYTLLVSISEHSNFNIAYGISAVGIIGMITLYSFSVFQVRRLSLLLVATLSGIYGFLFVTLQLADYALLMGSIGLAIILSVTMYFTRNINWYKLNLETK
ncbi:cell envelope integrity protein CreD [Fulvivirga lutea]|uniref:Cell envelope integrity protein CreD n=1 Tax=Fulvivirga lutea TaxID=2810512 RepID=A0A974WP82_9BACT|nr:cell envelope integrity protein CreD [Fulvivirga lutea]QSE99123.1 cell envelope integrity protein CreD [Fulvivirga lutea]